MTDDENEAAQVITSLRSIALRLREVLDSIAGKKVISLSERERLRALYAGLKADVKSLSKNGTVTGAKKPQTEYERCYFAPALRDVSNALRAKTNSHPISGNWLSSFWEPKARLATSSFRSKQSFLISEQLSARSFRPARQNLKQHIDIRNAAITRINLPTFRRHERNHLQ